MTQTIGQLAQSEAKIPLNAITVIGVLTGPRGDSALLRLRNGAIRKVAPGERADRLTVLAITAQSVAVRDHRGQTFALTVPGGR